MLLKDNGLDEEALDMIAAEDVRQREKWGFQKHDTDVWFIILSEEVGELAAVLLQGDEPDLLTVEKEATQVATVAIKMAYMARKARIERTEQY
jgi:NTP pyrophosphatase (non-canonical NTP hydrolase)